MSNALLHRLLAVPMACLLMSGAGWAQGQGGQGGGATGGSSGGSTGGSGGTGGTGGSTGGGNTPTNLPRTPTNTPQQPSTTIPEMPRPIFLSGRVVLEDGTPPPERVVIERVCNGISRPEGYTDSKGRFSFQVGQNSNMVMDASFGGRSFDSPMNSAASSTSTTSLVGGTSNQLWGCELRAVLTGYQSESVNLSGRRSLDNPDVGTIKLTRLIGVTGLTVSNTSLEAPKDARKAYDKARSQAGKQKWADAEKEYTKAVTIYPKYAEAWYELGLVRQAQNKFDEAKKSYAESISLDSKFVKPYLQLALLSAREQNWKDAAEQSDTLLKLNPFEFPQAYYYNAVAYYNLADYEKAEASAQQLVKLDTQHKIPRGQLILGVLLSRRGDLQGAAENLRSYIEHSEEPSDIESGKKLLADVEMRMESAKAQ